MTSLTTIPVHADTTLDEPTGRRRAAWAAAIAGPAFAAAVVIQAATRDGFSLAEHPLSLLAHGPGGAVQTAAFLIAGIVFITCVTIWLRTRATDEPVWSVRLIGLFGICLVVAGLFPTDPYNGYPAGANETTTSIGALHNAAAGLGGFALVIAAIIAARHQWRAGHRRRAVTYWLAAAGPLVISGIGFAVDDLRIAFAGGAIAWIWASAHLAYELQTHDTHRKAHS